MGQDSLDEQESADSLDEQEILLPIRKSTDEYPIKDYLAARIKKPEKGEAHVVVTNKRAIIYFWTKKAVLVNEAQISEITSTDIFWDKRNRRELGAIILALGILGSLLLIYTPVAVLFFILIAIGIYLLIKEWVTFGVTLYVKSVTDAISLHNYPSGAVDKLIRPSQLRLEGKPGRDAEILAKEIGSYILDIQRGTLKK